MSEGKFLDWNYEYLTPFVTAMKDDGMSNPDIVEGIIVYYSFCKNLKQEYLSKRGLVEVLRQTLGITFKDFNENIEQDYPLPPSNYPLPPSKRREGIRVERSYLAGGATYEVNLAYRDKLKDKYLNDKYLPFIASNQLPEIKQKQARPKKIMDNQNAFIMMAFADNSENEDLLSAIKRACKSLDIEAIRADEIEHSGRITDLILNHIKEDKYLICDITNERPNVYYELGYAHGIDKTVTLVAKEGTDPHFDIQDYSIIFYKSFTELEERLTKRIKSLRKDC